MKIFITNRNLLTWPKAMSEKFLGEGHEVIFIDNGSTYEPLLDWYDKCGLKIHRLDNRMGNRAPWDSGIVMELDEPYVCTDPDYDLSMVPSDWAEVLSEGLKEFPHLNKFGLSWNEALVPPENPAWIDDDFCHHPEGLPMTWGHPIGNNWQQYPCDTSFAVQRPHTPGEIGGIRKGRPYTGEHYPWLLTLDPTKDPTKRYYLFDDEVEYYYDHCENSSMTWGRMIRCGMIAEYKRRKANGSHVS